METQPITLTEAEIIELTRYKKPAYQLRFLAEMHIPARKRPDNTVLVMRMHCQNPAAAAQTEPKLKPIRK